MKNTKNETFLDVSILTQLYTVSAIINNVCSLYKGKHNMISLIGTKSNYHEISNTSKMKQVNN